MADTLEPAAASNWSGPSCILMKGAANEALYQMANSLESNSSLTNQEAAGERGGWFKLGAVAALSVLAGGVAAAWWYRNTLKKLHQAEDAVPNPDSGISGDDLAE